MLELLTWNELLTIVWLLMAIGRSDQRQHSRRSLRSLSSYSSVRVNRVETVQRSGARSWSPCGGGRRIGEHYGRICRTRC